jgi:hypothetical protein
MENVTYFRDFSEKPNSICDINNSIIDSNRTDCTTCDKLQESPDYKYDIYKNGKISNDVNINIFRFKFTQTFINELYNFSKIHQYDERKHFKEAWTNWIKENEEIVSNETRILTELGYSGDILDKMFKSARYYFRKKSSEQKEPKKRREYVGTNRELLDKIDEHIYFNLENNSDYKPSDGFDNFCKENINILKNEVIRLMNSGLKEQSEIKNKIKKTYKNRYFIIINK